ncbi:hypothetical protein E2493_03295 [Sphingomonas parva]|uniref:Uncharacterized protein n=1 Tax=Sphingomonas parva TaxID=2555898 RepID=A0A4Y8ZVZ6_9SPHN|nr:hypothetical protein [Sphingomonas parva]TFI59657.1 hypothetical protein E2493_03295 [Sphingomonas parva]
MPRSSLLTVAWLVLGCQAAAAEPACTPRPLPPAAASLPPRPAAHAITFAATPSLDLPGRPWVVRISSRGSGGEGQLEILRLRRQFDCNRYDVEKSWEASLSADAVRAIVASVLPLGVPAADALWPLGGAADVLSEVGTDGTGISLDLASFGAQVSRQMRHDGPAGHRVSAIFHDLVSRHVPAAELPTADWRMKRPS